MKSTALHHQEDGLCIVLAHSGGRMWRIHARPVGHGYECTEIITHKDSAEFSEKQIRSAITVARAKNERTFTLRVNGHNVRLPIANVERKIADVAVMEEKIFSLGIKRKRRR